MKRVREWFFLVLAACLALTLVGTGYLAYVDRTMSRAYAVGPEPLPVAVGVRPGDTLWSIAVEFYPGRHTGEIVHEIRKANAGVDPGRLQVGQRIVLPEVE